MFKYFLSLCYKKGCTYLPGLLRFRYFLRSASEEFGADAPELSVIVTARSNPPCGSRCKLPPHVPWASTPLTLNTPYIFLFEAVGAFCKLSEPLKGRMEQLNILCHFFCNTVPEVKASGFCWLVVLEEELSGDWCAPPSTAWGKWSTWEGNRKPSFKIRQR